MKRNKLSLLLIRCRLHLRHLRRQRGQALLEFMLVMCMTFVLALGMLKITNNGLAKLWKIMIEMVAKPSVVQLR